MLGGLVEAKQAGTEYTPLVEGNLVRQSIDGQNNTKQAGQTYREFEEWERAELIRNLVRDLSRCDKRIQDTMIALAEDADEEYGSCQPLMSCAVAETLRNWISSSLPPVGPRNATCDSTTVVEAANALGANSARASKAAETATGRRMFTGMESFPRTAGSAWNRTVLRTDG